MQGPAVVAVAGWRQLLGKRLVKFGVHCLVLVVVVVAVVVVIAAEVQAQLLSAHRRPEPS